MRVILGVVDVTEADIARIPRSNLRVPVEQFVAVWREAERGKDWYAAGVAITCQWMATAAVPSIMGGRMPARAPVTSRTSRAYEELIEAEYLAAEKLDMRRPRPNWLSKRPGWSEGVSATLRWAWRRNGPPPLRVPETTRT